jgi:hypothetical protein
MMQLSNGQVTAASKKINGKVTADYNDLDSIYIENLKTKKSTLTERGGYFSINASVGDTLLFAAVQFKSVKIALKKEDFYNDLLFVKMETLILILDEVKINEYKDINAVALGIISPKTKHYTPAERKLHEATTGSGLVPLNPILNAITGRTKQLKKEVEVEKKETMLSKIDYMYDEKYFIETLQIPKDFVKGFEYYLVEDAKFVAAIKAKNKTMATFIMNELAVTYKDLIATKP